MKRILIAMISLSSSIIVQAEKLPFQLPPELMTPYGVIAPLCFNKFTDLSGKVNTLNLKKDPCLHYSQPYNDYALKNGFIGYNLKNEEPGMKLPYIFYRYIGKLKRNSQNQYAFLISWSGGGTGSFTELLTFTLNKDELRLKQTIASGDRCNGSVKDASINNNQLKYRVNMTSFALYALENKNVRPNETPPFSDCAVCCIGTINYIDNKLSGIQFNGQLQEASPKEKMQFCFNHFAKKFGAEKKAFLNPTQLKRMQFDIQTNCLKK